MQWETYSGHMQWETCSADMQWTYLIELSPVFLYGELDIVIQVGHHITIQLHFLFRVIKSNVLTTSHL